MPSQIRSAALRPSALSVTASTASAWVCSTNRAGSAACTSVSTLGAGLDASSRAASSGGITSSFCTIVGGSSRRTRARSTGAKPSGPIVAMS